MFGNDTAPRSLRSATLSKIRPRSQDAEVTSYRSRSPITRVSFGSQQQHQKQQQKPQKEKENEEKYEESIHQLACPWNKVKRLKSRENQKNGDLHPRAWGVRSPQEIRCTCKLAKSEFKRNTPKYSTLLSMRTPEHADLEKDIENLCNQIETSRITLNKDEINEIIKKIRASLDKKLIAKAKNKADMKPKRPASATHANPTLDRNSNSLVPSSPPIKERTVPRHHSTNQHHGAGAVENILMANPATMTMTPTAVVGTMESTNYVIELTSAQAPKQSADIPNFMSQVIPLSMGNDNKPKLVSVDGAYFAEIPQSYGSGAHANHQQPRPDSGVLRKRTENVTFYAMTDNNRQPQNVTFAKPKSSYSNAKYVPVTKVPTVHLHNSPIPIPTVPHMQSACKQVIKR